MGKIACFQSVLFEFSKIRVLFFTGYMIYKLKVNWYKILNENILWWWLKISLRNKLNFVISETLLKLTIKFSIPAHRVTVGKLGIY